MQETNELHIEENLAVSAKSLGKAYRIYDRKRDRAKQLLLKNKKKYFREHWALKDINFELRKGESLGIVGRNGSGKSTLLQLICGTIRPTEGDVKSYGKIAALLELGSGFNPDFSGRENIYLNATLLGLNKKQIRERMDDILAFADIGEFVDQPVRTYSSGMSVRLAFSVIAHVDADILVVDEALAVGDAYFTQKCMRFIQRFREKGSLLFVSHDANAVLNLCNKALLINEGRLAKIGTPRKVVEEYTKGLHKSSLSDEEVDLKEISKGKEEENNKEIISTTNGGSNSHDYIPRWTDYRTKSIKAKKIEFTENNKEILKSESFGGESASITDVRIELLEKNNKQDNEIVGGEIVRLVLSFQAKKFIQNPISGFILKNDKGLALLGDNTANKFSEEDDIQIYAGDSVDTEFIFTIPLLPAGEYSISVSVANGSQKNHEILHWINDALLLRSQCTSIAAGVAGIPMHSIKLIVKR